MGAAREEAENKDKTETRVVLDLRKSDEEGMLKECKRMAVANSYQSTGLTKDTDEGTRKRERKRELSCCIGKIRPSTPCAVGSRCDSMMGRSLNVSGRRVMAPEDRNTRESSIFSVLTCRKSRADSRAVGRE